MMTLYCDESDDGETYALAGWLAVPSARNQFEPAWRAMLETLTMPDGSACPSFHAVEIVGREQITGSRFKGWTFEQETVAFTRAADLVARRDICALLWPIGAAIELPASVPWIRRNSVWTILYMKLLHLLIKTYPAQRSIGLIFDEKPEVSAMALRAHQQAKEVIHQHYPDYFATVAFDDDERCPPLQAADFLAYEWRKRISDARFRPDKPVRRSYKRIRESRPDGALWRFGREVLDRSLTADDPSGAYLRSVLGEPPTHRD